MIYAQLNQENICVGVSELSGAVPEYNYATNTEYDPITNTYSALEQVFVSRMVSIPVFSDNYIGLHYKDDGTWERITG